MTETQFSRRLDTNGRLVIPARLREKMSLIEGDNYEFFIHEENGKRYLCIECPKAETDLEKALRIIKENGMTVINNN